jgi:hypothetical protein
MFKSVHSDRAVLSFWIYRVWVESRSRHIRNPVVKVVCLPMLVEILRWFSPSRKESHNIAQAFSNS